MTDTPKPPYLTPAEIERLAYLSEELAEVQHCVCKILRHGWDAWDPTKPNPVRNRVMLESEIGGVQAAICLLVASRDVDVEQIQRITDGKIESIAGVAGWLHHQGESK